MNEQEIDRQLESVWDRYKMKKTTDGNLVLHHGAFFNISMRALTMITVTSGSVVMRARDVSIVLRRNETSIDCLVFPPEV